MALTHRNRDPPVVRCLQLEVDQAAGDPVVFHADRQRVAKAARGQHRQAEHAEIADALPQADVQPTPAPGRLCRPASAPGAPADGRHAHWHR
jgi:hypothetical protein